MPHDPNTRNIIIIDKSGQYGGKGVEEEKILEEDEKLLAEALIKAITALSEIEAHRHNEEKTRERNRQIKEAFVIIIVFIFIIVANRL